MLLAKSGLASITTLNAVSHFEALPGYSDQKVAETDVLISAWKASSDMKQSELIKLR